MLARYWAPGSPARRVLTLAWPSVAEQSLITLIGLVDAFIVGHLGAAAIAGVGLGSQVLNVVAALFGALGVGGTALVARMIGAKDPGEANRLMEQALWLALGVGLICAIVGSAFARSIIVAFGAAPEVVAQGATWLAIVSPSFAFMGVLLVGNATLRGAGDTRSPLVIMIAVNVVNVVLSWTLTRGLFGLPALGVAGTAIGSGIGQAAGALAVITMLIRGRGALRLPLRVARPDLARIRRILNIGLPAGAEQVLLQIALLNLAVIISSFGTAAYAAHTIGLRISSLSFLPGWGFSIAATTLVGQSLGARRPDEAKALTYAAFWMAFAVMLVMGVILFVFEYPILSFFTSDPAVLAAGEVVLRMSAAQQPVLAASFVFSGALRGAGDTRTTLLITVTAIWGLRLGLAYLFGIVLGWGLFGAWLAIWCDFALRSTLHYLRFRSGGWARIKI